MTTVPIRSLFAAALVAVVLAPPAVVAADNKPVAELGDVKPGPRKVSLPAHGLFEGDHLSESTKVKLTELVIDAKGLKINATLVVPNGPWRIDGGGHTDRDLTEKRLAAIRRFLADRGLDPKRIYVENRIDASSTEPRLDIELVGEPLSD